MEYSSKIGKELKKQDGNVVKDRDEGGDSNVLKDRKRAKNRMHDVTAMCGVQLKDRKRAKNRMGI